MMKREPEYIVCTGRDGRQKVVAITRHRGKTVRAVATCQPDDIFDEEFGKKVAKLKLEIKLTDLRYKNASKEYDELVEVKHELCDMLDEIEARLDNTDEYLNTLEDERDDLVYEYMDVIEYGNESAE